MTFFSRSKPVHQTQLSDGQISEQYHYWRLHIMLSLYVGYALFYFTRKSFNYAMPAMITELGLDKAEVGLIGTLFYITYGCSKFLSGIISDRSNPRYFMGVGLIATGVINIFFGLSSSIVMFTFLWMLNAWFQGWGSPSCAKLLTSWYSRSERGFWWSLWNTSHHVGSALVALSVSFLVLHYSWQTGFVVSGSLGVLGGIFLCWRLRDKPTSMGLPSIGQFRDDHLEKIQESQGQGLTTREILKTYVFRNKYIWLLSVSYVLVYIVRMVINDWGNLYLTEYHHYDLVSANAVLSLFEAGGFMGSLVAGWGSDRLFGGNRGPMNLIFAMGIFLSVAALWLMPVTGLIFQSIGFFTIGFFVFGPQLLIGMAAAECAHKDAAGAATGFVGLFAYTGAAFAGYPFAIILKHYHWTGLFITISVCAVMIGLLLLPFLQAQFPKERMQDG
ncbi:MFS transporter [Xenorhabdus sp. 42]|uniref:MFS transporter n=1 Tax=Xenorhabdus szentirmaii TaxID=290112 RepID=A0AAW3Z164_9GAMM|nr:MULTISPECIES: MFS transporter [unclassified Xenorhabdus]MBD2793455.1 MFS transporter [Xenorhabdus sp. CUL]MBD2802739.1 MFS transporter [Xenorhabdus sp. M]MBD2804506.1 MFS transporter [Xenorhabdus sp. ZM]MBD2819536.1 MFS transporter [Xenorhabdus sp. 42]MBD2826246.1 MFS transporter [Xenorhabdus sp. 5]